MGDKVEAFQKKPLLGNKRKTKQMLRHIKGSTGMSDPNCLPVGLAGGPSGSSLLLSGLFSVPEERAGVLFSALPWPERTKDSYLVIGSHSQ